MNNDLKIKILVFKLRLIFTFFIIPITLLYNSIYMYIYIYIYIYNIIIKIVY